MSSRRVSRIARPGRESSASFKLQDSPAVADASTKQDEGMSARRVSTASTSPADSNSAHDSPEPKSEAHSNADAYKCVSQTEEDEMSAALGAGREIYEADQEGAGGPMGSDFDDLDGVNRRVLEEVVGDYTRNAFHPRNAAGHHNGNGTGHGSSNGDSLHPDTPSDRTRRKDRAQHPAPSNSKELRRSPRVAAKAASALLRDASDTANRSKLDLLRGVKNPSKAAAGASSTTATPSSSRRERRVNQVLDFARSQLTPSSVTKEGCFDDPNTSFRTAIMGDATPGDGKMDVDDTPRRVVLFADDDPSSDGKQEVSSRTEPVSGSNVATSRKFESKANIHDGIASGAAASSSNSKEDAGMATLAAQMSSLTFGAPTDAQRELGNTAPASKLPADDESKSESSSPHIVAQGKGDSHGKSMDVDMLPAQARVDYKSDAPTTSFVSRLPKRTANSPRKETPVEALPPAGAWGQSGPQSGTVLGGQVKGLLPLGKSQQLGRVRGRSRPMEAADDVPMATDDHNVDGDDEEACLKIESARAVAQGCSDEVDSGVDEESSEEMNGRPKGQPLAAVEREGRALAAALMHEAETCKRVNVDKILNKFDASVPKPIAVGDTRPVDNSAEIFRKGVQHSSPPEADAPSRDSRGIRSDGARGATPPEIAGERHASSPQPRSVRPTSGERASEATKAANSSAAGSSASSPAMSGRQTAKAGSISMEKPVANGAGTTVAGTISTVSAQRVGRGPVSSSRTSVSRPMVSRRQSSIGSSSLAAVRAEHRSGPEMAKQPASRGVLQRGRSGPVGEAVRGDAAVHVAPDNADDASGPGSAPKSLAGETPAVAPSLKLLAPTAASQNRARPRSASPAMGLVRGRMSVSGAPSTLPGRQAAGVSRRTSSVNLSNTQSSQEQQKQRQQVQQRPAGKPRASSTGRRALTTPSAPNLRTSHRPKVDREHESTEDLEVQKQREMQDHLKEMTRRNQVAMERSRRNAFSGNVRSSKPLTVPESPAMRTVGRLGGRTYAPVGSQVEQLGFSPTHPPKSDAHARENQSQAAASQPKGPTVPQPFKLSQSNRPNTAPPASREDGLTFRETMSRIENKTPERYRTRPSTSDPKGASSGPSAETKPTLPVSPRLRTEARAAGHSKSRVMSREEREEAELAEMKKHQFKARPFRPDGFGVGGEKGVFRPQHSDKQLTQPAPFRLSTENRAASRAPSPVRNRDDEELAKQFKARPMPGRSSSVGRVRPGANVGPGSSTDFKSMRSMRQSEQHSLTAAASPMLATKRRSAVRSSMPGVQVISSEESELEEHASKQFKARPMPDYSRLSSQSRRQSVAPADSSVSLTEPRPFHLRSEERGRAKQALLAQRMEVQRKQEEKASKVRARPLPPPSMGFVPTRSERPPTETSEFVLPGQARHERATLEFRERVRQEEEAARRAMEVKALPLPAATFEAPETFRPKSGVPLTEPVDIMLHTTSRAEERAHWEEGNQARIEAEEQERLEHEEAAAEAEKEAIAELRRKTREEGGMSFKARPIAWNKSPPECAQPSAAPLTTPITPILHTRRRAIEAENREKAPIA